MASSGQATFDRTVYGNSGNTGGSVFGGGGAVMGSPAQIAAKMGFKNPRKKTRNKGRMKPRGKRK